MQLGHLPCRTIKFNDISAQVWSSTLPGNDIRSPEFEGSCPSHIIILCNGHIWKLDTLKNNKISSICEIRRSLQNIKENSVKTEDNSIVKLTTLERNKWSEASSRGFKSSKSEFLQIRKAMIANTAQNSELFRTIESAVFCLTLSDDLVENESQVCRENSIWFNFYCSWWSMPISGLFSTAIVIKT